MITPKKSKDPRRVPIWKTSFGKLPLNLCLKLGRVLNAQNPVKN
jgi:hypothetical protein